MRSSQKYGWTAFTLIELIATIAAVILLVAVLIPALAKQKAKKQRIDCVNNLKQIGLSFRIWSGPSGDRYPTERSTNDLGTMEFFQTSEVYRHFQALSNELGSPRSLVCPADKERSVARSFSALSNSNLSYFVSPEANENLPTTLLSGDRNITNGFTPKNGILDLTTNQLVGWTAEIHVRQGNIALGDGSVQQVSSERLRSAILPNTGLATNRIQLP